MVHRELSPEDLDLCLSACHRARRRGGVRRHHTVEELLGTAWIGFQRAQASFDPSKGVPFKAWALRIMDGEIREWFRRTDWCSRQARAAARREGRRPAVFHCGVVRESNHDWITSRYGFWNSFRTEPSKAPDDADEAAVLLARLPPQEQAEVLHSEAVQGALGADEMADVMFGLTLSGLHYRRRSRREALTRV